MTALFLDILRETWTVTGQMAPYLLFGFLAAGALSAFVSPAWLERHLGGHGFMPVMKSVLLGVPLPLCSCGVIAVTASIRQHGASRAAATGFLLATPQTGVDSILATWGMLGPLLGVVRPLIALASGLLGGLMVMLFGEPEESGANRKPVSAAACCGDGCHPAEAPRRDGLAAKTGHALHYGLVTLPGDIARPLIVGMLIAGAISALVPPDSLAPYIGGGIGAMLAMIVVGVPLYVCATASIPLAVGFIHMGASPGAALAFLIAGPATNAATLATVWKMMGRRTALLYLASVFITALLAGLGFDALAGSFGMAGNDHGHEHHAMAAEAGSPLMAALLVLVVAWSLLESRVLMAVRPKAHSETDKAPAENAPKRSLTLSVKGMTCSHCRAAVERALQEADPAAEVTVDLGAGRAVVTGGETATEELLRAVAGLGYDVTESV